MTYARFNRLLLVPSFALLLGACTSSVPLDELPAEYASAFCEVFRGCAGELASYSVQSSASCEPRYEAAVAASAVPRWQALLERGTVSYDASKAAACIEGVRAIGCELNGAAPPAACDEVFVGTLETGAACSMTEECAGDAYCDGARCPTTAGRCAPRKANGVSCDSTTECQAALSCVRGVCSVPSSNRDGVCGGASGGSCPLDQLCLGGDGEELPGTCTDIDSLLTAAIGESCQPREFERFCQSGASCAATSLDGTSLAFECVERVGAGEACYLAFPSMCPEGRYCTAQPGPTGELMGTCEPLPTVGMPCVQASGTALECAPGLDCQAIEGTRTCVQLQANGGACSSPTDCASSFCDDGVCAAPELCAG